MLVAAAIAAVATLVAAVAERDRRGVPAAHASTAAPRVTAILGTPGVAAAIFASVAALSATDVFTAYLPVVGEQVGIGPVLVGVLLALRAGQWRRTVKCARRGRKGKRSGLRKR